MMKKILVLSIISLFSLLTYAQYDLVWGDEFEGTGVPDENKWDRQEYNRRNNPNGPDGWWSNDDSYLDGNGNLVIRVREIENKNDDDDPYDYAVGMVHSKGKFEQLYGRYECRCKLPTQQGWWVAFWMMQGDVGRVGDGGVDGMEIDIMEAWGWTDRINHAFHWDGYGEDHQVLGKDSVIPGIREGYHTYTLDWTPEEYVFYIDGVETWRSVGGGVCKSPGYVKITGEISTENWAVGDWWSLDPAQAQYPDSFLIDYVRVYDLGVFDNDSLAPAAVENIVVQAKSNAAQVTWDIPFDDFGVKNYKVFLDSELLDTVTENEIFIEGLEPETAYGIGILACDFTGKMSEMSQVSFTTRNLAIDVPARIEAEDYYEMEGIQTEPCRDDDGGINVGWIEEGDWLSYVIKVPEEDSYQAEFRVASESTGGNFDLVDENNNVLTSITVPSTGSWQKWESVLSDEFTLESGQQTIKIISRSAGYNLNWFKLTNDIVSVSGLEVANQISVYPNPLVNGNLNIKTNAQFENDAIIQIYNIQGKEVYSTIFKGNSSNIISLSDVELSKGLYILSLECNNKFYRTKLVIEAR